MIKRIEVYTKILDTRAEIKKKHFNRNGFTGRIKNIWIADVYTIEKHLTAEQLRKISQIVSNPITQTTKREEAIRKFNFAIEIGFLPGVTDNVANTAKEIIEDLLKIKFEEEEDVYTSQVTFIEGNLSKTDVDSIAETMFNPLIQRVHVKNFSEFRKSGGMDKIIPKVVLKKGRKVDFIDLNVDDSELIEIGKRGIKNDDGTRRGPLALNLTYMKTIQKYFKKLRRNPTDIEIESIAQTWSEHCKHTIFADPIDDIKDGLFKTFIKGATDKIIKKKGKKDFCVSVFEDNSGAIEFDQDFLITHKVETHNSPSALDPFGGAITGIVGVNRDTIGFGLGAKPIANIYGFCFGNPNSKDILYKDANRKMLSPRRIMDGVIDGINSGGNCSGIPTPQGFVLFDDRYQGKPLVFAGTIGLIPKKIKGKKSYIKKAKPGDYIVMVGGRVGQDGIHGATFSSEALTSNSPATAVQIGDPITQKKLSDAIVKEARDMNLYSSITDNGAGGLSCSVAEMAKESGGCIVELSKIPLKYPGLDPWQIWISESQERMTLSIPKNKWGKFEKLMKIRGVEATRIGIFTKIKKCVVKYKNKKIMDIDMNFLHNGLPKRPMKTVNPRNIYSEPKIKKPANMTRIIHSMLQRINISGLEFISSQYDHEVQGSSVLKPLQGRGRINSDATVVKPLLNSQRGVVISQGIYPFYSDLNAYDMAGACIDTAIRNAVCAGADINKLALLDNFCWCSPDDPKRLYQLKMANKACFDLAVAFDTPFISGKDSMFNDFKGFDEKRNSIKISIPPTLLISSLGVIDDISKAISLDAKFPGDLIYVLGETREELGASEYFQMTDTLNKENCIGNIVPKVNALKNKKLYKTFHKCLTNGLMASAISVGRGGLGVALAKVSMGGMLGIDVSLEKISEKINRDDFVFFSESQGRIIATINPVNKKMFEKIMKGNSFLLIGEVTDNNKLVIKGSDEKTIIKADVEELLKSYKSKFKDY
ncbi:MAG: phosphoribosylformylglycinamidine synthase subunit PurL [bacterium]|nr:phosphoribosylformylglycinamidine synthase subunit PurL [bacterium]